MLADRVPDHDQVIHAPTRSPGQAEMAFFDRSRLPIAGKVVITLFKPPDTLASIDQLELEALRGASPRIWKWKAKLFGRCKPERLAGHHIACAILKLEIQPHGAAGQSGVLGNLQPHRARWLSSSRLNPRNRPARPARRPCRCAGDDWSTTGFSVAANRADGSVKRIAVRKTTVNWHEKDDGDMGCKFGSQGLRRFGFDRQFVDGWVGA